jgi:3-oxoacyl-[acyl-carrier protein] reductase
MANEKVLEGQVAVVTGGSRGIGRAIAIRLAGMGAHVFVNYTSNQAAADDTVKQCLASGGSAEMIRFSVGDSKAVTEAFDAMKESKGRIDILINNAGIARDGLLARVKDEDWAEILNTNLSGSFYCARAASRIMMKARYGRIVNVSSVTAEMGNPGQTTYISSKAGLIGMTKALAKELGSRSITVNAITPGFIETEMTSEIAPDLKENYLKAIPLGRFAKAEEVAELVAFLAGPSSAYITGQTIGINGGMYM